MRTNFNSAHNNADNLAGQDKRVRGAVMVSHGKIRSYDEDSHFKVFICFKGFLWSKCHKNNIINTTHINNLEGFIYIPFPSKEQYYNHHLS